MEIAAGLVMGMVSLILLFILALIFFMPSLVAFKKQHPHRWPILIVNLFLGSTIIGWALTLLWAFYDPIPTPSVIKEVNER